MTTIAGTLAYTHERARRKTLERTMQEDYVDKSLYNTILKGKQEAETQLSSALRIADSTRSTIANRDILINQNKLKYEKQIDRLGDLSAHQLDSLIATLGNQ